MREVKLGKSADVYIYIYIYISFAASHDYFTLLASLKLLNFALNTEQLLVNAQTNQVMVQFMKDGPQ